MHRVWAGWVGDDWVEIVQDDLDTPALEGRTDLQKDVFINGRLAGPEDRARLAESQEQGADEYRLHLSDC